MCQEIRGPGFDICPEIRDQKPEVVGRSRHLHRKIRNQSPSLDICRETSLDLSLDETPYSLSGSGLQYYKSSACIVEPGPPPPSRLFRVALSSVLGNKRGIVGAGGRKKVLTCLVFLPTERRDLLQCEGDKGQRGRARGVSRCVAHRR